MADYPMRKENRLKCYDYRNQGCYFITFCTHNKEKILWKKQCTSGSRLSEAGTTVDRRIRDISVHYANVLVDKYVVMPNHVHILLRIESCENNHPVSEIIKNLKRAISMDLERSIWQKGYHDHIVRYEHEYQRIWMYIDYNPEKWLDDCYYC